MAPVQNDPPSPAIAPSLRDELECWLELERRFNAAASLDELRAVAEGIPLEIAAAPEIHGLQCALLLRAWPLRPDPRLPPWPRASLPISSRLAWARLALLVEPTGCGELLDNSLPWAALLEGLDLLSAPEPMATLGALLAAPDEAPRRHALAALRGAVTGGFCSILEAHELLCSLLVSPDGGLRAGALRELAAPWAAGLPVPRGALARGVEAEDDEEALAAVEAAGVRGLMLATGGLGHPSPERRVAAVRWVGRLGERDALGPLLEAALDEPEHLGVAALEALVALHHRGIFLRDEEAPGLLELLARGVPHETASVAGLLFVARRRVLAVLSSLDTADPDWLHLAPLLAAWLRAPRPPAGLFDLLLRVGAEARRPAVISSILGLLRDLAIDLLSAPHPAIEALALARLDAFPEESARLLQVVAGAATRARLLPLQAEGTGGEASPVNTPWLPPAEVFEILWWSSSEEERGSLVGMVRPSWLRGAVAASLKPALPAPARDLLLRREGTEDIDACFEQLAEVAEPGELDEVLRGLRRVLEHAVALPSRRPAVATTKASSWDAALQLGGEERWQLPERCVRAVEAMEARWCERHRRPVCLLAPGKRLLPELLLRLLEEAPSRAFQAGVLRSLQSLDHPLLAARAGSALLEDDADVSKLGARLLARRGAPWLAVELARGVARQDERVVRACLEALAAEGEAWAAPIALQGLSHRNMNVKKAAAAALERVATASCAPVLLRWLGQQDNPGLRGSLRAALRKALGEGYRAGVLAALREAEGDERRCRLLIEALDREVTASLVRRWARRPMPWFPWLLGALQDGVVSLAGGSLRELAPELRAAGLLAPGGEAPKPSPAEVRDPFCEAVDALFFEGWSPERAAATVALWPDTLPPETVGKLRTFLGPWLDWMVVRRDPRPASLLRAILGRPGEAELALLDRAIPGLLEVFDESPRGRRAALVPLLEALLPRLDAPGRLELGGLLRRHLADMPGLGRSPLGLLRRCGLVLTRDDVERALDGVGVTGNPAEVRRQILAEAFGLAGKPPRGESALAAALRAHGAALLGALRASDAEEPEDTLRALVHELPAAWPTAAVRAAALDWMEALRPIGVETWPFPPTETAVQRALAASLRRPPVPPRRRDHEARQWELGVWLQGQGDTPPGGCHAVLDEASPEELEPLLARGNAARCFKLWERGGAHEATRRQLAAHLQGRWGELTTPQRDALQGAAGRGRQGGEGHGWVSPRWHEEDRAELRRRMEEAIENPQPSAGDATDEDRARWEREARGTDEEAARLALTRLSQRPGEGWRGLLLDRAEHGSKRVRHHALRLVRKTLAKEDTWRAARWFLEDEDPAARRMAIRIVCHGEDGEALPAVVALLLDPVAWVREEALEGLRLRREEAMPLVERAQARARPDEARRLGAALARLRG